jgi:hypothetical protein
MKLKRQHNIQIQKPGAEGGSANQDHLPVSDLARRKAYNFPKFQEQWL